MNMATIVHALGFEQVDALGVFFGGMVAFRLAVQHPPILGRLVLASVPFAYPGFYADIREQQKEITREGASMMMKTPLYDAYKAVAPRVDDFPEFVVRMGEAIRTNYDWSEDAKRLKPTTMLVYGDSDMFEPEHIVQFYQLLGGGLRDAGWDGSGMARQQQNYAGGLHAGGDLAQACRTEQGCENDGSESGCKDELHSKAGA